MVRRPMDPPLVARLGFLIGSGLLSSLAFRFFSHMSPDNPGSLRVAFCLGSALTSGSLLLLLPALWPDTGRSGGPVQTGLKWGGIIGGIALLGGFLGPLVFFPDANLGPFLGLLVTGPLGWSVGTVAGLAKGFQEGRIRRDREDSGSGEQ